MKISKKAYLHGFTIIVLILGAVRLFTNARQDDQAANDSDATIVSNDRAGNAIDGDSAYNATDTQSIACKDSDRVYNRILSVANYDLAFPDLNDVQLEVAKRFGVTPVENRAEAESRKNDLVYVGACPYFAVDKLRSSIPYLVPRAAVLLQDIGKAYYDSLDMKGVPLHTIIATSLLRTKEDVAKLRIHNRNATENSCHLYGTTFDIAQNRFITVEDPNGPHRRAVTNDTLKWVLSEVLRDLREEGRCYVKYEKHQGCFHISVR